MKIIPSLLITIWITLALLGFSSCASVDLIVDTSEAVPLAPDSNGDGLPDKIAVPSSAATPALSQEAIQTLNDELAGIVNPDK